MMNFRKALAEWIGYRVFRPVLRTTLQADGLKAARDFASYFEAHSAWYRWGSIIVGLLDEETLIVFQKSLQHCVRMTLPSIQAEARKWVGKAPEDLTEPNDPRRLSILRHYCGIGQKLAGIAAAEDEARWFRHVGTYDKEPAE